MTQDDNVVKLLDFGEALQLADMGKNPALLRVVLESVPAPVIHLNCLRPLGTGNGSA